MSIREKPRVQVAMPLFASTEPIPTAAILKVYRDLFPEDSLVAAGGAGSTVQFLLDGRTVFITQLAVPVPIGEVLGCLRASWMWQAPDAAVRAHRAHAIVTVAGSGNPLQDATDVTTVSAAMLKAGSGVALYWGSARQVHAPDVVERFALADHAVPLWVGVHVGPQVANGPLSAATHGLESFGHKEFEVIDTRMGGGDLCMLLLDLAVHVLRAGPVFGDGETLGRSADVRWSIRHAPSKLVAGRHAIVLGIP